MTLTPVKTAAGLRLRHPRTKAVLPNVADEGAEDIQPIEVNLADPHWYKALRRGDIAIADPEKTPDWLHDLQTAETDAAKPADDPAPVADPTPAKAALPAPTKAAPSAPAAADPALTTKPARADQE